MASSSGFYNDYNYGRSVDWLKWITNITHTRNEFRNVGMLELVNEPQQWDNAVESMRKTYYPEAIKVGSSMIQRCSTATNVFPKAIRQTESDNNVASEKALHIQMMNTLWGSGKPTEFLDGNDDKLAFDDHRYVKYDSSVDVNHDAYIQASCKDDRSSDDDNGPTIVGEWSLSVPDNVEKNDDWSADNNKDFYTKWFAAQVHAYETSAQGWVFWTWKANLGDYRWSYKGKLKPKSAR